MSCRGNWQRVQIGFMRGRGREIDGDASGEQRVVERLLFAACVGAEFVHGEEQQAENDERRNEEAQKGLGDLTRTAFGDVDGVVRYFFLGLHEIKKRRILVLCCCFLKTTKRAFFFSSNPPVQILRTGHGPVVWSCGDRDVKGGRQR